MPRPLLMQKGALIDNEPTPCQPSSLRHKRQPGFCGAYSYLNCPYKLHPTHNVGIGLQVTPLVPASSAALPFYTISQDVRPYLVFSSPARQRKFEVVRKAAPVDTKHHASQVAVLDELALMLVTLVLPPRRLASLFCVINQSVSPNM